MKKYRTFLWFVIIALSAAILPWTVSSAQERDGFSGQKALEYVRVLAGDDMGGRLAGFDSGRKAGAWIADRFKDWGLEPAGPNGYFQDFKKSVFHVQSASFSFETGKTRRTLAYDDEWQVAERSGSAAVEGELVFAGYGIVSDKDGWNDFDGLDLKDKIVFLISYGAPEFLAGKIDPQLTMPEAKIAKAYELGARAVVMMDPPVDILTSFQQYPFPAGVRIPPENYRPDLAVAGINTIAAKAVFEESGIDLYTRAQQIEKNKKPGSEALGIRGKIDVRTVSLAEAPLRNVLAKIAGSDRSLRDEVVIIGGHYDGLGLDPDGRTNPGADDNASGTAIIMEIARVMAVEKAKPKRTVVFALWDGEEEGLWGSEYYSRNPVFPLNKTLAKVNIDMVGNGDGGLQFRGVYYTPEFWQKLKETIPAALWEKVTPTRGGFGGSDHTPFLSNGVPTFYFQTTGDHYGRHDIGDKASLVDSALLEKSGILVKAVAGVLADSKDLKLRTNGRELNLLRGSTIVDLAPRDAASLIKEADTLEYPDLDFVLVAVSGATPTELAKSFYDISALAQTAKKVVLYKAPTSAFSTQRFGERIGILPGVTDLAAFNGQESVLRLLGRAGLGYVIIRDKDFERGEDELRRMIAAAEAEGILVIAWQTDAIHSSKLGEWSTRPGLLVTDAPDAEVLKKMKAKQWRLALNWPAETSPEAYAASVQKFSKEVGERNFLLRIPGLALKDFSPDLVKLMGLILPKELSEMQLMTGSLDLFGQNFINLLRGLRPPAV